MLRAPASPGVRVFTVTAHPVAVGQSQVRLGPVVDDHDPEQARVVLREHGGHRGTQRTRPVVRRHHHAHRRPAAHGRAPTYP